MKILLTGATGFIGGRLLDALVTDGHEVRAVSRRAPEDTGLLGREGVEVAQGDVTDADALPDLLAGCELAFYMVHSMEGGPGEEDGFVERDREAARAFGRAARRAGVSRIIYLSGLEPDHFVSKHLASRNEVERELARSGVPVTVLRAGFIIGSGSAGFQMLEGIVGRMSRMLIPPDMHHVTQPTYVDDVLAALRWCVDHPEQTAGRTFDLGAEEPVSYFDLIREFCLSRDRDVVFEQVPWVPNAAAATYISAVSGLPYALVHALSEGLKVDLYAENDALYDLAPELPRTPALDAMRMACEEVEGT